MGEILLALALSLVGQVSSTISGRILSMDGNPAVNVRVSALAVTSNQQQAFDSAILSVARTDSTGRYRLENLPPGRYFVAVGLVNKPTYFPGVADLAQATVVALGATEAKTGLDFTTIFPDVSSSPPTAPQARPPAAPVTPEPMILKTIYLSDGATAETISDLVDAVRSEYGLSHIKGSEQAHAIVLRDTPEKVALTERVITEANSKAGGAASSTTISPSQAIAIDALGNPSTVEAGSTHRVITGPQLQLKRVDPISIRVTNSARGLFHALADMAGLNVALDRDLTTDVVSFAADNVGVLEALDLLSAQTRSFWKVLNGNSILVAPDSPAKHRDHDLEIIKTIYLANTPASQAANVITAVLSLAYVVHNSQANAIVVRDTANRVALAEKIIADLDKPASGRSLAIPPLPPAPTIVGMSSSSSSGSVFVLDAGRIRDVTPKRAMLQPQLKARNPISFKMKASIRVLYQSLAEQAGLNIIFDHDFDAGGNRLDDLGVNDVDILDALDLLSLQTGHFWEVLDNRTIFVAAESAVKHQDFDIQIIKTITLSNTSGPAVTDIVTAVRTLLSMVCIAAYPETNAIVLCGTPGRVAVAEKIIADLDRPGGTLAPPITPQFSPVTAIGTNSYFSVSSVFELEAGQFRNRTPKRSLLQLNAGAPVSVTMNEDARVSFEILAGMAGLAVIFDSRFTTGMPSPFSVANINVMDALDYLSRQTQAVWKVVDSKTILIAPDNAAIRRELEPPITKTFTLTNARSPESAADIIAVARRLANLGQTKVNAAGEIEITDTPNKLVLAERIILDLDKPRPTP